MTRRGQKDAQIAHNGMVRRNRVRRRRVAARALAFGAVTLAGIVLAPVILLVGEPVRRHYLRRLRLARSARVRGLARALITNPVMIALTAPGRWVIDRLRRRRPAASGGPDWPPSAGVREPRRPRPNVPVGAVALAEPRQRQRTILIRKAHPPALSEPVKRGRSRLPQAVSRRLLRRPRPT